MYGPAARRPSFLGPADDRKIGLLGLLVAEGTALPELARRMLAGLAGQLRDVADQVATVEGNLWPGMGERCAPIWLVGLRVIMEIRAPASSLADRPQGAIRITDFRKRREDRSYLLPLRRRSCRQYERNIATDRLIAVSIHAHTFDETRSVAELTCLPKSRPSSSTTISWEAGNSSL